MSKSNDSELKTRAQSNNQTTDKFQNAAVTDPGLTKFQIRILAILAEETRYGLAIKRELEAYYAEDVNHGRLYPNLDTLVEKGLIQKTEKDKRTNNYILSEKGYATLRDELDYLASKLDLEFQPTHADGDA